MTEEQWEYWVSPNALSLMIEDSQAWLPEETGGILIGWMEERIFHIEVAVGPGPKAIHKRTRFTRDGDFSQGQLDKVVLETEGRWDYLGEWHSHPQMIGPSIKDITSMKKIRTDPAYQVKQPILGICMNEAGIWRFCCYLLDQSYRVREVRKTPSLP